MRNHPEILDAVIIDGVVPVAGTAERDVHLPDDPYAAIFAACAADAACASTYGDVEAALREAYAALEAEPAQLALEVDGTPRTVAVDGTLAMSALYSSLYGVDSYATLPYLATAMRDNNYAPLVPLLNDALEPAGIAIVMHFAITCTDDPTPELPVPDSADPFTDVDYDDNVQYSAVCPIMGVERLPDSSDTPVQSDLPTLILQGAFDPVTPPRNGDLVAETLPNSTTVVFSNGGHVNGTHTCGVAIMAAFLRDLSQAPDTSCAEQPLAFAVPQTVTASSANGSATLAVTLPPGWTAGANGSYVDASYNNLVLLVQPPQAPEDALAALTAAYPGGTITDGEAVAGLPSKRYQFNDLAVGQATVNLDAVAFSDAAGTYIIFGQNQLPGVLNLWRSAELPAIVQTATVGGP